MLWSQVKTKNMGIARGTLREWTEAYPSISTALKRGKEVIDIEVENAMCKRALGYEDEEDDLEDFQ